MKLRPPTSMARRFALVAAGLAAAAVLLISLASWWLINRGQLESVRQLAATERQFRAEAVGGDLNALADRMSEMTESTILATGLVDSAGRETYLSPFLAGIRQVNGVPVQVLLTDFEGKEIASNGIARFSDEQLTWLRRELEAGRSASRVFSKSGGFELVALAPMRYARTSSPEGALFYKISLGDLFIGDKMTLEWGPADPRVTTAASAVPVAPVFEPLAFRVRSTHRPAATLTDLAPQYLSILLIASILFAAVVFFGAKLAELMTRDLHRLQRFASRFLGSGLSQERAAVQGSQEVASLAASINKMLDRLDEQHSTLLLEREKLSRLTDALRIADRRKDDFLAMLAHELRNPLAPIMTGAELLKRIPGSDKRVMRTSEIIARQARHMREILEDLLDVSRVTRGLITLDREEQNFSKIVRMAIEQVRPLIDERGHALLLDVTRTPITVLGDRARLIQVLSNLLTNAAKYTPEGGQLKLIVQPTEHDVCVVVDDNGDGIAPELMPELFDLFSQGSRSVDRKQGGLGLGLALVKHLVELHGGSVHVASGGEGRGSTFTIYLPRLLNAASPVAADTGFDVAALQPGGLRLMLVDDNLDAANSLAAILEMYGHSVQVAHDSASALAMLGDQEIDAFLLDIGLPGMNGYELARELRSRPQARRATLIAITGYGQAADRDSSTAAGFDHHLVKPVDAAALLAVLPSIDALAEAEK